MESCGKAKQLRAAGRAAVQASDVPPLGQATAAQIAASRLAGSGGSEALSLLNSQLQACSRQLGMAGFHRKEEPASFTSIVSASRIPSSSSHRPSFGQCSHSGPSIIAASGRSMWRPAEGGDRGSEQHQDVGLAAAGMAAARAGRRWPVEERKRGYCGVMAGVVAAASSGGRGGGSSGGSGGTHSNGGSERGRRCGPRSKT